jgi:endonuclease V-like protein UPF0215 family
MGKKTGLRLFGVEDGSFGAFNQGQPSSTILCGVKFESDRLIGVKIEKIQVDGLDATEKLLSILNGVDSDAIILGGITFAGFNIIDPHEIFREKEIPVIVYSGKKPNNEEMLEALKKNFDDWQQRWKIIKDLGPIHSTTPFIGEPPVYFEVIGVDNKWAKNVLHRSAIVSRIPEPVRVAGIIARGLSPVF